MEQLKTISLPGRFSPGSSLPWSNHRKIAFRFAFLFFLLFIFLTPNSVLPYSDALLDWYPLLFSKPIIWMGHHLLGISGPVNTAQTGSGDRIYDILKVFFVILVATLGAVLWTLTDRRRTSYNTLRYWLIVLVRYYLAIILIKYGSGKIVKMQFPFPGLSGLLFNYGDSSPFRLAWYFFGYSKGYNYFMGFSECLCGVLLLFRRTQRLGSLLSLTVVLNIIAINYNYDICVKLYSTFLGLSALFLLWQNWRAQLNFFLLNRTADSEPDLQPLFHREWLRKGLPPFKYIFLLLVTAGLFSESVTNRNAYGDGAPHPPLYGIYEVQTFVKNKDTLAPLITDTLRWRKFIVATKEYIVVRSMDDRSKVYSYTLDSVKRKLELFSPDDTAKRSYLDYSLTGKEGLLLRGNLWTDTVSILLKEFDLKKFRLMDQDFHFINETPPH